jgi:hypothetical protein
MSTRLKTPILTLKVAEMVAGNVIAALVDYLLAKPI